MPENVPMIVREEEISVTELLAFCVTQIFPETSTAIPADALGTENVPRLDPDEESSVTLLLLLFETQTFPDPSIAIPVGELPLENVPISVPDEDSSVTVVLLKSETQRLPFASNANPKGADPAEKVPSVAPNDESSVTVLLPPFDTQTFPEASMTANRGVAPTENDPRSAPDEESSVTLAPPLFGTHKFPDASMAGHWGVFPTENVFVVVGSPLLKEKPPGMVAEVNVNPVVEFSGKAIVYNPLAVLVLLLNALNPDSKRLTAETPLDVVAVENNVAHFEGVSMQDAKSFAIAFNPVCAEALRFASAVFKLPPAIISINRFTMLLAVVALFVAFKLIDPLTSCSNPKFIARSSVAAVVTSLTRSEESAAAEVPTIERS